MEYVEDWVREQNALQNTSDSGEPDWLAIDVPHAALNEEDLPPPDPLFLESGLEACLGDYLPLVDEPPLQYWPGNDDELVQPWNLDDTVPAIVTPQIQTQRVDAMDQPAHVASPPLICDQFERRLAAVEEDLRATRGALDVVSQELSHMNDWACRVTFVVNELQLQQRGLSPVLQHFGKVLPVPFRRKVSADERTRS